MVGIEDGSGERIRAVDCEFQNRGRVNRLRQRLIRTLKLGLKACSVGGLFTFLKFGNFKTLEFNSQNSPASIKFDITVKAPSQKPGDQEFRFHLSRESKLGDLQPSLSPQPSSQGYCVENRRNVCRVCSLS